MIANQTKLAAQPAPIPAPSTPQMVLLQQIAEATGTTAVILSDILQSLQASANLVETLIQSLATRQSAQPAATPAGDQPGHSTFVATEIIMGYTDNGEPTYKLIGAPYVKYGVKAWPEVLPLLGIDETTLHPGRNPIDPTAVKCLNGEKWPKKVIGLATGPVAASAALSAQIPSIPPDQDDIPF